MPGQHTAVLSAHDFVPYKRDSIAKAFASQLLQLNKENDGKPLEDRHSLLMQMERKDGSRLWLLGNTIWDSFGSNTNYRCVCIHGALQQPGKFDLLIGGKNEVERDTLIYTEFVLKELEANTMCPNYTLKSFETDETKSGAGISAPGAPDMYRVKRTLPVVSLC